MTLSIVKGLAVTFPIIGRVSIGTKVQRGDKMLPQKDDQFHITTQVKNREGAWIEHSIAETVRAEQNPNGNPNGEEKQKIRVIPIRLIFDKPELNFRTSWCAFDTTSGRPVCQGDGERARRRDPSTGVITEEKCVGADSCPYGKQVRCKLYSRFNFRIEGQEDEFSAFSYRSTAFNTARAIAARLTAYQSYFGGKLANMPLSMVLRGKTTTASRGTPIYYVDLELRRGKTKFQILDEVKSHVQLEEEAGFNREQFEIAMLAGINNSTFEFDGEEGREVIDEFLDPQGASNSENNNRPQSSNRPARTNGAEFVDEDGVIHAQAPQCPVRGIDDLNSRMRDTAAIPGNRLGEMQQRPSAVN